MVNDYRAPVRTQRLALPSCLTLLLQRCPNPGMGGLESPGCSHLGRAAAAHPNPHVGVPLGPGFPPRQELAASYARLGSPSLDLQPVLGL